MPKFRYTQNLRPSNDKVIFQRPSCGSPTAVASGFIAGGAPVEQYAGQRQRSYRAVSSRVGVVRV